MGTCVLLAGGIGAVRVSVPAVKVSVPVSVQVVPAATAPPHATA